MVTIEQLQQLVAIDHNKTLSGAAEVLHISQPALSRSIQKMEAELRVSLFNRKRNHMELNNNGILAVEHAQQILQQVQELHRVVWENEQKTKRIVIGSCAPAPLWSILPVLSECFSHMTITSEVKESEIIEEGLHNNIYDIAILQYALNDDSYQLVPCCTEKLFLTIPPAHPLAHKDGLYLNEIDGITMLLMTELGFWGKLGKEKMPNSKFLLQNKQETFQELVNASALPAFTTDLAMKSGKQFNNRVIIPILDPEASVTFYIAIKKSEAKKYQHFLNAVHM